MSKLMSNLGGRAGISGILIDSAGTVLATPPDQKSQIGKSIDEVPLLSAMADRALNSDRDEGSLSFGAVDGSKAHRQLPSHCRHRHAPSRQHRRGQGHRGDQERDAHRLSGFPSSPLSSWCVCRRKAVIRPMEMLAEWRLALSGRPNRAPARTHLPAEFVPLARAFNAMASQLAQRKRELVATNDRLTVIASIDMLSGLAYRRGFQSRLDFK